MSDRIDTANLRKAADLGMRMRAENSVGGSLHLGAPTVLGLLNYIDELHRALACSLECGGVPLSDARAMRALLEKGPTR